MSTLTLVFAGLRQRPLQTFLLVLSMALSSAMTMGAISISDTAGETPFAEDEFIVTHVSERPLLIAIGEQIKRVPDVIDVDSETLTLMRDPKGDYSSILMALTPGAMPLHHPGLIIASKEVLDAFAADRQGVIAPREIADRFNWRPGQPIVIPHVWGPNINARFIGYFTGELKSAITHFEVVRLSRSSASIVNCFTVHCPPEKAKALMEEIDKMFEPSDSATMSLSSHDFVESVVTSSSVMPKLITVVGIIVVLVTAIMIACTLSIALNERTVELAILRALGFSKTKVLTILLSESLVVALTGGLIGAFAPFLLSRVHPLSLTLSHQGLPLVLDITLTASVMLAGVAVAVAVSLFVTLPLVLRAFRISIIEGLAV